MFNIVSWFKNLFNKKEEATMSNFSAVLVGINKYNGSPLRGCVNDVIIMRDILVKKYKVPSSSIRLILDERATKDAIEERLEWLVTNDASNKLFYYSGHGAQIPIQTYKDSVEEVDGMNELLCPVDFDWNGTYILDNTINYILGKMSDLSHLTMVIDSCHSGTIDRDMSVGADISDEFVKINKTIPTPLDLLSRASAVTLTSGISGLTELFDGTEEKELDKLPAKRYSKHNVSVLTGCREDQTSADAYFKNRFQGALSYYMQKALMKSPSISLNDLRTECALKLYQNGYTQVPQILGKEVNINKPFIQV